MTISGIFRFLKSESSLLLHIIWKVWIGIWNGEEIVQSSPTMSWVTKKKKVFLKSDWNNMYYWFNSQIWNSCSFTDFSVFSTAEM